MEEDRFEIDERRRRRLSVVVAVVALLALVACGVVMYPRLIALLQPEPALKQALPQETNDVTVARGPLTQTLLLGGAVEPQRTARLSFAAASGPVAMVYVETGMPVAEGDVLLELDEAVLQRTLATVRGQLLEARVELERVMEDRGLTKRIELEEDLRKANRNLDQVRRDLDQFKRGKGTPEEERAKAVAALSAARDALTDLREGQEHQDALESLRIAADLAQIEHGPYAWIQNPSEEDRDRTWLLRIQMLNTRDTYNQALLQHEMNTRAAEQKVVLAQRELEKIQAQITAGSPAAELEKRQAAVQQAEARVQQLQDQLDALEEGTADPDVAKAEAAVVKLEGRAADAEASLQDAKLRAPFDGTVGEVLAAPGAQVMPGAVLLTLYSSADLRVVAQVNEMDVGRLAQGQQVDLSFEAFPGELASGILGEIPRYGTYQNGLTYFRVPVAFDAGETQLFTGMSATVRVPLAKKDDVLLVPTMAVQRDAEGYFVLVVKGDKTTQRRIEIGISDGIQTEVAEGLEEGEIVRVFLQYPIGPIYR